MKDYLINVKLVVAFGEAKRRISDFVMECGIPCRVVDTVEEAVAVAYNASSGGEVVLFSPACASWDQFKDFEVRGKVFKDCVSRLY